MYLYHHWHIEVLLWVKRIEEAIGLMPMIDKGKKKFYIKINEDEIANDYPLPAFYEAAEDEWMSMFFLMMIHLH